MMRQIRSVEVEANQQLRVAYDDGSVVMVDMAPIIAEGGVWARLADPAFFAQVRVGERGRCVEWPGDLDYCADAVWLDGRIVADASRQ